MSLSLRDRIIRLAREDEKLKAELLHVLNDKQGSAAAQPPIIIQQPPIIIQQPPIIIHQPPAAPAPVPPPVSDLRTPEGTQNGFRTELQPELERLVSEGRSRTQAAQELMRAVNTAFVKKDMLYNILIRYQSSFEGDTDFQSSLLSMIETWASTTPGV